MSTPTENEQAPSAMRILGYPNPLSARPGEQVALHVSSPRGAFDVRIIRFRGSPETSADARETIEAAGIEGTYPGRAQAHQAGSLVRVADFPAQHGFDLTLDLWPTLLDDHERGLVTWAGADSGGLAVTREALVLRLGDDCLAVPVRLETHQWYRVHASYDAASGDCGLALTWTDRVGGSQAAQDRSSLGGGHSLGGTLTFGAWVGAGPDGHFNGKLTGPTLAGPGGPAAAWDFGGDHASDVVVERVHGRHGQLHNAPVRAAHGPTWDGTEIDPRRAPAMYDAIHFLEDSVADVGWEAAVTFIVPDTWRSGIYAAVLDDGVTTDEVPFYVRAKPGAEPPLLFLAPTNTYIAYGNERTSFDQNSEALETMKDRPVVPNADDHYLRAHPELGMSVYDTHRDGSGCVHSTRLRPILAFRAGYRSWLTDTQRHFAADLYLLEFLEREGIEYAVAVDEDLDAEGPGLLRPFKAVATGSHPEYFTGAMLDGIREYLVGGGRLAYLGGNGFYWVTGYTRTGRHTIEVRRGFTGDTNFTSYPGESHLSCTGEPGGIWRLRGRDPRALVGVGFVAKGWGRARPYRRRDRVPARWEWVFDGVPADAAIGDEGRVLDGAAGDELDCLDVALGSPTTAVVLAVADGFDDMYQPVIEDYSTFVAGQGGTQNPNVRADMVAFETPGGGAVFSVGSICWIPSLPANDYANPVARITGNVLRRFASDEDVHAEGNHS